jgi:lysozyme
MLTKNDRKRHGRTLALVIGFGALFLFLITIFLIILLVRTVSVPDTQEDTENYIDYAGGQLPIIEDVPVNNYDAEAFASAENGTITYSGGYATYGIDVSSHQGDIDWAAVAASNIDFAMIRVGYRGFTEGGLFMDDYFTANISGATENGIDIGVYFFSQAITPEEARQEANYVLEAIRSYDVTYPVVFDWEYMHDSTARTEGIATETVTQCALAFCETIQEAGYTPAIYFNNDVGYLTYDLGQICMYDLWLAEYDTQPDFYYNFQMWQYTSSGTVAGIETYVDLNISFKKFA